MRDDGLRRVAGIAAGPIAVVGALVLCLALSLVLGACSHNAPSATVVENPELNAPPTDYRREIVAAMHAYLNDPTGIRDAEIAQPAIKTVSSLQRYIVCVRFNAKKRGSEYAGVKEVAAVFMVGRFDHFVDKPKELCADASFTPFPELQKLSR
jgi:hypothetical protein